VEVGKTMESRAEIPHVDTCPDSGQVKPTELRPLAGHNSKTETLSSDFQTSGGIMELTDKHLEAIRQAAQGVEYGSVTINISANSNKLDLNIQNRIRLEKEPCKSIA
jgi:hypothetical protein